MLALLTQKVDAWRSRGADPRRVDAARWSVARSRSSHGLTNEATVDDHLRRELLGDPIEVGLRFPTYLRAVSKPAVDHDLAACLRGLVIGLEGPEDSVRAALPKDVQLEPEGPTR